MNTFLLIGGGEINNAETKELDLMIKVLCKKKNPKILFFPIAAHESEEYINSFSNYFNGLGFTTAYCKISLEPINAIRNKLLWADALYFGGGNTIYALEQLKKVDFVGLLKARRKSLVISGISAGAMIWCKNIILDDNNKKFKIVKGIGLIDILFRPHFKKEQEPQIKHILNTSVCYGASDKSAIILDKKINLIGNVTIIKK